MSTVLSLFSPVKVGALELKNRIVMAPMTRSRARDDGTPTPMMATYYEQRAQAGLMVSEGVAISAQGRGFLNIPGIFQDSHEKAWAQVVERVHRRGCPFVMQLWHVGRIGHPDNMAPGLRPVAPSAIAHDRTIVTRQGMQPAPTPDALTDDQVRATIADYAAAGSRAIAAGCDAVEIHAANGYLPAQFLHETTNVRDDAWGGSLEKRARFLIEATRACAEAVGPEKVGVRLSPFSAFNGASSAHEADVYRHLLSKLSQLGILFLHVVTAEVAGNLSVTRQDGQQLPDVVGFCRPLWPGTLMAAGGFDRESAQREIGSKRADLIAFGRDFIGNPDLPTRMQRGLPIVARNPPDWYGATEKGYTDYPAWQDNVSSTN